LGYDLIVSVDDFVIMERGPGGLFSRSAFMVQKSFPDQSRAKPILVDSYDISLAGHPHLFIFSSF